MKISVAIFLLFSILTLSSCSNKNILPSYVDFDQLPEHYSIEEAQKDGCVVVKDAVLVYGKDMLENFVKVSGKKDEVKVRFANYISANYFPDQPKETEYITDLEYSEKTYSIIHKGGETKEYEYLNYYLQDNKNSSDSLQYDCYYLTHSKDLTLEQIERAYISSNPPEDWLDVYLLYFQPKDIGS